MFRSISALQIRLLLVVVWLVVFLTTAEPMALFFDYVGFSLLGVVGAIFANSTGAGGGVVFMPFFSQLNFSAITAVSTSFAIQCCGMTAGALTWWAFYQKLHQVKGELAHQWQGLYPVLYLTIPTSILGVLLVQYFQDTLGIVTEHESLDLLFGIFSIILAVAIFVTVPLMKAIQFNQDLVARDLIFLPLIALIGGAITAVLSIGVGELIAVYLILRRFNVTFSIACAVILSAFTVWSGIIYHVFISQAVYWPIVLFAGPGAIVGGILAKRLVLYFSARNLKLFFAGWILIMGLSTLPY
ncbi:sulfite exporter TauE/SafE family protein [Flavobacterium sp. W21_SRS_FM6]|uniref:sulfite exporter TauE/SafE family protein n=1 Tax=Flavobacterium sp. W21_SRS_FM6 TaxID=3240268 RepID=UPI003F8F2118